MKTWWYTFAHHWAFLDTVLDTIVKFAWIAIAIKLWVL